MSDALTVFHEVLEWIKSDYTNFNFFMERDFVWTVQKKMMQTFKERNLSYKVINDCAIQPGAHRSKCVDLAVVNPEMSPKALVCGKDTAELCVEFKFEPSEKIPDIYHKTPVVEWTGVLKDIDRVRGFVSQHKTKIGIAILIDEYGRYRHRTSPCRESNLDYWGNYNDPDIFDVHMLYTKFDSFETIEEVK